MRNGKLFIISQVIFFSLCNCSGSRSVFCTYLVSSFLIIKESGFEIFPFDDCHMFMY